MDEFCSSTPNQESKRFWNLVNTIERELESLAKIVRPSNKRIDLLEVFCHPDSMLSAQVLQVGGSAKRHGLNQGDLMTSEGRRTLFTSLLRDRPNHVWVSPICGPWGKWSNFNSLRSMQAWDTIHAARWEMLSQVALCFVICRHQHRCQRHAHWEQPKGSKMMVLPYIQEIFRYMLVAKPDMCTAGNLRDPNNDLPIQKGLQITTSSKKVFDALVDLKCNHDHVHQAIEGSVWLDGQNISRSRFTERYPRKFARLVAKVLVKKSFRWRSQ